MSKDKNVKDTKENLKYFELTLFLPKDNKKEIFFIAPAKTSGHLVNALEDVVKYILKYQNIGFNIDEMS